MGALEAEAKVFEAGLLLARDIGIQDVILEGDSLVIYIALCEASLPPSSVASVVLGMLDLCNEFRWIKFSHVKRKGCKVVIYNIVFCWLIFRAKFDCNVIQSFVPCFHCGISL